MAIIGRLRRLALATYTALLLVATLAPVHAGALGPTGFDKLIHVVLFFGLGALVYLNLRFRPGTRGKSVLIVSVSVTVGVVTLIEALQGIIPYRDADAGDLVAGVVGAVLGVAASAWQQRALKGREPPPGTV